MEAMVGGSKDRLVDCMVYDGLVDGMVDNWCWLRYWDDTAAHLTWKLHRDLPARVFILTYISMCVNMAMGLVFALTF